LTDVEDDRLDYGELLKIDQEKDGILSNPFAFVPTQLARLHDPKDLNVLRAMGGLNGLVYGLQTDHDDGLGTEDNLRPVTLDDVWNRFTNRQDGVPECDEVQDRREDQALPDDITPIEIPRRKDSEGTKHTLTIGSRRGTLSSLRTQPPFVKEYSDRRRVFGENRLPVRKPKNIFRLMWMALHDKILVLLFE
jgi:P-type Ca2+ transporter type 2C